MFFFFFSDQTCSNSGVVWAHQVLAMMVQNIEIRVKNDFSVMSRMAEFFWMCPTQKTY